MYKHKILYILLLFAISINGYAQDSTNYQIDSSYQFTPIYKIKTTSVKSQDKSGTCWSYATSSFLEAEILRITGDSVDIAEMYFVRHAYVDKAKRYIRYHGSSNFGAGGQAHDVMNVIKKYGLCLEETYPAKFSDQKIHNHAEMDLVLISMLNAVTKNKMKQLSPVWLKAYEAVLDTYLGETSAINNEAVLLKEKLKVKPEYYIELTSYNHHPFYKPILLELPDNWSDDLYLNLPLEDFVKIAKDALRKGYSICWDGDVGNKGFNHKKALAINPDEIRPDLQGSELAKWVETSKADKESQLYSFEKPIVQQHVDQSIRQKAFDNYTATDDHLMHITGLYKDQYGNHYFQVKNSWGNSNDEGGYLMMSESYFRKYTVAIMIHKDAVNSRKLTN